ncbi:hypothetical protein [Methylomicrobium sp. Wu6]|uniref:hypothetical protein n=1 Tax=Methylomicrobium sp. Wu6 TaxID=3107928 RepID=UPI002DD6639B|nr:hypothetical protein [Methylomicrobium sp. Wu6]MEC4747714.1 hypothetical protein [Methylomicrobium sp. Wu6]
MNLKDNFNFQSSCDFFPQEELKRIPRHIHEKMEEERRQSEAAEIDAIFAELHDNDNDWSTPFKHLVISQVEQEEIDAIFAELDDWEVAPAPVLPEPSTETKSNGFREYAESGDLDAFLDGFIVDSQPREVLIERLQELFSKSALSVDEVALARKISIKLSKLGVPPIERGLARCKLSDGVCEKDESAALMMNHLQTFDIQWGHTCHPGHKTHEKAFDGKFANIFASEDLDWDHAMEIATLKLKPATKAKYLNLPASCLLGMLMLRGKEIHERQKTIRRQKQKEAFVDYERSLQLEAMSLDIEAQLIQYGERCHQAKSRLNIGVYVNVWKAVELSKGNKNYLASAKIHYEKLTGESISKSLMQKRVRVLENALKKTTVYP